jgi:Amt family ammonium transporter
MGYDDSLDAFGVHGIGGLVGAILTGVFAAIPFGGNKEISVGKQVGIQLIASGATIAYAAIATLLILLVVKKITGLRVDDEEEIVGLDVSQHDERGYNM